MGSVTVDSPFRETWWGVVLIVALAVGAGAPPAAAQAREPAGVADHKLSTGQDIAFVSLPTAVFALLGAMVGSASVTWTPLW